MRNTKRRMTEEVVTEFRRLAAEGKTSGEIRRELIKIGEERGCVNDWTFNEGSFRSRLKRGKRKSKSKPELNGDFICKNGRSEKTILNQFIRRVRPKLEEGNNYILLGTPTPTTECEDMPGTLNGIGLHIAQTCSALAGRDGFIIVIGSAVDEAKAILKKEEFESHKLARDVYTEEVDAVTFLKRLKQIKKRTTIIILMSGERKWFEFVFNSVKNELVDIWIMANGGGNDGGNVAYGFHWEHWYWKDGKLERKIFVNGEEVDVERPLDDCEEFAVSVKDHYKRMAEKRKN